MEACRFLHWLPPDDGTGKYSFTKKALTLMATWVSWRRRTLSTINWTVVGQPSWQYLRRLIDHLCLQHDMRLRQRVERVHLRQLLTRGWDNWMVYASECFAVRRRRLESWLETHENYVIGNVGNCYIWHKLILYSSLLYFLVLLCIN